LRPLSDARPCAVTLDRDIDLAPFDFVSCADFAGAGAVIEDCHFHDGHVRGILTKSSDSVIRHCRFERLARSGVVVAPEIYWLEGPFPHNVRVERNTFVECGFGAVGRIEKSLEFAPLQVVSAFAGRLFPPLFSKPMNMRRIQCIDNRIVRAPGPGILIMNAEDVEISGNTIIGPGAKLAEAPGTLDLTRNLPRDAALTDARRDAMARPGFGILLAAVRKVSGRNNRAEGGRGLLGIGWNAEDVDLGEKKGQNSILGAASAAANPADVGDPVTFQSSDPQLQRLHDSAVEKIQRHIIEYAPGFNVLANSGDYTGLYLENAALNGENYARFDPRFLLNNIRAFFIAQRDDGKFPNVIWPGCRMREMPRKPTEFTPVIPELDGAVANFGGINGLCFPCHAWRAYFWNGKDREFLQQLYSALEKYDGFLWKTRDSDGDGLLELWCMFDSGEDHSSRLMTRYAPSNWTHDIPPGAPGAPLPTDPDAYRSLWMFHARDKIPPPAPEAVLVPFESMDVNAYSHAARNVLALISAELGNGKEAHWSKKAEEVRERIKERLWVEEKHACYDIDRHDLPRMFGIYPVVDRGTIWWSALDGAEFTTTQHWGGRTWTLDAGKDRFTARLDGKELFSCARGVRVVTDLAGDVREIIGIAPGAWSVAIQLAGARCELTVKPNEVWDYHTGQPAVLRRVPFDYPHQGGMIKQ
jgi:hypothetical protein